MDRLSPEHARPHQRARLRGLAGWSLIAAFACTPLLANWLLLNVGAPGTPRTVPVWPGIMAPSGVFAAGLALSLRDLVHEAAGRRGALVAILLGTLASIFIAPPALVVASGAAFLVGEGADLIVYAPLRERGRLVLAILLSNTVGLAIDSVLFLLLAFGSLDFLPGQLIAKMEITLVVVGFAALSLFRKEPFHV